MSHLQRTDRGQRMEANRNLVLILFPRVPNFVPVRFPSSKIMKAQLQNLQKRNNAELNKLRINTNLTPFAGLFFWGLGFEKIFKTQGIFKTQKPALLVLCKGVINLPLQSSVNQYFSQREKYWLTKFDQLFSKKNHEK